MSDRAGEMSGVYCDASVPVIGPFSAVTRYMDCTVLHVITVAFKALIEQIRGPLYFALFLYVLIYGLSIVMGNKQSEFSLGEIGGRFVKLGLVVTLITNWDNFYNYIFSGVFDLYRNLGGKVALALFDSHGIKDFSSFLFDKVSSSDINPDFRPGKIPIDVGYIMDVGFQKNVLLTLPNMIAGIGESIANGYDPIIWSPGINLGLVTIPFPMPNILSPLFRLATGFFMVPIVMVCLFLFYAGALFMYITASLSFMIIILLAPIFIFFFLFEATKGYATTWTGAVVAATIMPAALQICLAAMSPFVLDPVDIGTGISPIFVLAGAPLVLGLDVLINTLIIFSLGKFLMTLPSLVNGLVGNFAHSGGGIGEELIAMPQQFAQEAAQAGIKAAKDSAKGGM